MPKGKSYLPIRQTYCCLQVAPHLARLVLSKPFRSLTLEAIYFGAVAA